MQSLTVDKLDENRVCLQFKVFVKSNRDWNVGHSLSAGGPGAFSAFFTPAGSPLDTHFPQESRTFRSNHFV